MPTRGHDSIGDARLLEDAHPFVIDVRGPWQGIDARFPFGDDRPYALLG
jgi:hypothetical protein